MRFQGRYLLIYPTLESYPCHPIPTVFRSSCPPLVPQRLPLFPPGLGSLSIALAPGLRGVYPTLPTPPPLLHPHPSVPPPPPLFCPQHLPMLLFPCIFLPPPPLHSSQHLSKNSPWPIPWPGRTGLPSVAVNFFCTITCGTYRQTPELRTHIRQGMCG